MWHRRNAGAQGHGTWDDLCLCSRYIAWVFQDTLSATAPWVRAQRRPNQGSCWLCGQEGLSVHLNLDGCLLSPCLCCLLAHRSTPSHISHALLSPFSEHPPMLSLSSSPFLPGRQSNPCSLPYHLAESHSTGGVELKENPFKSSSGPASRKVHLPPPQIKDTDAKLMPHLISAKKPRGFKTLIHLKL